jgi:hypothetical protein
MKYVLVSCLTMTLFTAKGQDSSELVRQANIRIDDYQKRFAKELSPIRMDPGVKNLLTRMITKGTDSIQQVVTGETDSPYRERLLALNAHGAFLDGFRYAVTTNAFAVYHIRDLRLKYYAIFDRIRHYQPYDDIIEAMGPKKTTLVATAFKDYPEGPRLRDIAIIRTAQSSPERIPGWLAQHQDYQFTDSLLMIWANRAAPHMARYLKSAPTSPVAQKVQACPNPLVQTIAKIAPERFANNYLPFAIPIAKGEMDFASIDKLRQDPKKYFQAIVDMEMHNIDEEAAGRETYYRNPLRTYLKENAYKFYVDVMNSRHEEAKESVRFAELNDLRPQDIYMVIVHGEDNFYTSSYLYTYHKLMSYYTKTGHDSLFRFMHRYQARKFVQLAGRYNTLPHLLKNMPRETMLRGVSLLAYGLESNPDNGLEDAMTLAETFPSFVRDSTLHDFMAEKLRENLERCKQEPSFFGIRLYTLLSDIYQSVDAEYAGKGGKFSEKLAAYLELPHRQLRAPEGTVYQRVFFYGDADGKSSFQSFMGNFSDRKNWDVEENKFWVTIKSKNVYPLVIYANLPLDNERYDLDKDAMDSLTAHLEYLKIEPHILIHRGHSYHLSHSLNYVNGMTNLAILGSCGGYQEVFSVQTKSKDAQVISTKQVGSKMVNEPLLQAINRRIVEEKDISWVQLWNELDSKLKKDKRAYAYFVDYVPPHKNIGLLVSKIYHDDGDLNP